MEDLIDRIAADLGVEPGIAKKAVGMILLFLRNEGPKDEIQSLFAAVPARPKRRMRPRTKMVPARPAAGLWVLQASLRDLALAWERCKRLGGKSSPMSAKKPAMSLSVRLSRRSLVSGNFFEGGYSAAILSECRTISPRQGY